MNNNRIYVILNGSRLSISQRGTKGSNQTCSLGRHESHEAKEYAIGGGSDGPVVWQLASRPTGIYVGKSISELQIQVATHVLELSAGNCHR